MEIFKSNEEVIDLVLTPKGRELLARGEFKPHSYSFHDIDVRYEMNNGEAQNQIVPRIKAAPRLKAPTYYASGNFYRDGKTGKVNKKHNLADEIGDKTLGDQYKPAWKLKFLNTPDFQNYVVSGSVVTPKYYNVNLTANTFTNIIENEGLEEIIPQININFYFQVLDIINFVETPGGTKYVKTYLIEDKDIMIELDEINSFENSEFNNFDVEIFLEATDPPNTGELLQLEFNKQIKDNFSVEKYLNILFDANADFEEVTKTSDIYGPGGKETPTNC